MQKLTDKEQRFVQEYAVDHNGTQACIRANYSAKAARQTATKMLAKSYIQEALAEQEKPYLERLGLDEHFVMAGIKDLAILPRGDADYNPHVSLKAYMAIGTHLRMFMNISETKVIGEVDHSSMSHEELMAYRATLVTKILQDQPNKPKNSQPGV